MKKNRIDIDLLHPENGDSIKVSAPAKIKLGIFQTLIELRFGLPPLHEVKPIDVKGLIKMIVVFLLIIVMGMFVYDTEEESLNFFALLIGLGFFGYLYAITRNYFRDFIRSKLQKGYIVEDIEQIKVLEETGTVFKYTRQS